MDRHEGSALLIQGDSTRLPVRPKSVHLAMCSPAFFNLRDYRSGGESLAHQIGNEATVSEYLDSLLALVSQTAGALVDWGNLFVNIDDRHTGGGLGVADDEVRDALGWGHVTAANSGYQNKSLLGIPWRFANLCMDKLGLVLRTEIIWVKPNATPETAKDRCRRNHEYIFHFTKRPDHYAAALEAGDNDGRPPFAVWNIQTDPLTVPAHIGAKHYAPWPPELVRKIIVGWSPPGVCVDCHYGRFPMWGTGCGECKAFRPAQAKSCPDCGHVRDWKAGREVSAELGADDWSTAGHATPRLPGGFESRSFPNGWACRCWREYTGDPAPPTTPGIVLDPCNGTGTSPMVAAALGRIGIGVDLSDDYLKIAKWRISDPAQRARVFAKDAASRQMVLL